jgi:hypothetical protein
MTPTTRCTFAEYQSIDSCNWSTLKYAVRSGLHYNYSLTSAGAETDAMRLGRATHTAVFEPDRLLHEYVIWEGGTRRGKEWEAFKVAHAGKTILKPDELDTACAIRDAVRAHPIAAALLVSGTPECTIQWTDKDTGIACKARLDWLSDTALVDLKTTRNIEPRRFGAQCGEMQYHGQLAFYASGLLALGLEPAIKIIAVENSAPHDVAVYDLGDDEQYAGEVQYQEALRTVAACRRSGVWPGGYPAEMGLMLPAWSFPNPEDEEALFRSNTDA